jgi:hypothetical protein
MTEPTKTNTELFCNSEYFGHETLYLISSMVSLIYAVTLLMVFYKKDFCLARVERLELPANGFGDHYSTN